MRREESRAEESDRTRVTRREALRRSAAGLGWLGLARLLAAGSPVASAEQPGAMHLSPRAKRVVLLFQHGGPSHVDLFDPKPALERYAGKPMPVSVEAFFDKKNSGKCFASPFGFSRHGQCGMELSELLPNLASCADDLCQIRSLHTEVNDHEGALRLFQTGQPRAGRPTLGAWVTYALGTENQDLPPYVVLSDPRGYQVDGMRNWSSGWLPARFQGTPLRSSGPALFDLSPPAGMTPSLRRHQLDLLESLNQEHRARFPHVSDLSARMANYELALTIGDAVTGALDLSRETRETRQLYGLDKEATAPYGQRCLMARRLLERGVRFVAVFNDQILGDPWDTHFDHNQRIKTVSWNVDKPCAGLIKDLKRRGLLDDTIVVWVGEFGRLPVAEGNDGRDHNRHAFTALVSGGGFKPGLTHGKTDDFGYKVVESPVAVVDLHATLLYLLGLDHALLTYPHQGRDESLTDPAITGARVIRELCS